MCSAPTRCMTKVWLSTNSPHRVVISRRTPEYQYPWFRFIALPFFQHAGCVGGGDSPGGRTDYCRAHRDAAAASETTTRPPSSVGVDVTATAVTMAADVTDDARYDPAVNVDGGPSPAALVDDTDNGGAVNTSVQVALMSVISNAAKSSLCAYFEGVNWPLNKALPKGAEFLNGLLGDIMRQFCLVKTQVARQLIRSEGS